jgi:acyl dehydratase
VITRSFDEIAVGDVWSGRGRTITETDVVSFCYLTGNWLEIHSNVEVAAASSYGQRLVQGSLTFSLIPGLVGWDHRYVIAFYGVDRLRFLRPVFIGDTVHPKVRVVETAPKDDERGVVALAVEVRNQRDEVVQVGVFKLLVRRGPLQLDDTATAP